MTATGVQCEAELPLAGLHQLLRPVLADRGKLPAPQCVALETAFGMTDAAAPELFLIALAALELLGALSSSLQLCPSSVLRGGGRSRRRRALPG